MLFVETGQVLHGFLMVSRQPGLGHQHFPWTILPSRPSSGARIPLEAASFSQGLIAISIVYVVI